MLDGKIGYELVTTGHMIKRERDRSNEEVIRRVFGDNSDVMCADLEIIKFLVDNKDREIYQKDIEQFLSLTAPSVSNKLKHLQKKGLIERVYSKVDTRLKQVILTDKAWDIDKKVSHEILTFESELEDLLTEEEQKHLLEAVRKIKKAFSK